MRLLGWLAAGDFLRAIVFAVVAVLFGLLSIYVIQSGQPREAMVVTAGLAIVFALGAMASVARGRFALKQVADDPRHNPQPWRRNREWLSGRIRNKGRFPATLVMDSMPAPIGATLRAHLEIAVPPQQFARAGVIDVRLLWVRRTYTGDSQSFTDATVLESEKQLSPSIARVAPGGVSLPLEFDIPADAEQSNEIRLTGHVIWLLHVRFTLAGSAVTAHFEVPVFRTGAAEVVTQEEAAKPDAVQPPLIHTIPVRETPGGLEIVFSPRRNWSQAIGLTAFTLIWTAGAVVAFTAGGCGAGLLFALTDLLPLYLTLDAWIGSSRVIVANSAVTLEHRLLRLTSRTISSAEIADVRLMLAGSQRGIRGITRNFYNVQVWGRDHKRVTLGANIASKIEGVWLVQMIRRWLGLPLDARVDFNPFRTADLKELMPS